LYPTEEDLDDIVEIKQEIKSDSVSDLLINAADMSEYKMLLQPSIKVDDDK